jgi:O-antigen/teichoic acid export membrane protein
LRRLRKLDLAIVLVLLLLPGLWFSAQTLGGRTLLPADNLFAYPPWQSFAERLGVGVPHNALISDLILENHPWKSLIRDALQGGEPSGVLWNPRTFAGVPFLAAGQHSALYPLSLVFYVLPLWEAYGIFTWLQLGLAALCMYTLARILRLRPAAAVFSAIAYAFSLFFIVSVNFTMFLAAASWLPLLLAMIERVFQKQEEKGARSYSPVPYVAAGALVLGIQSLAGHVEITYYVLMVSAFFAAWRLAGAWRRLGAILTPRRVRIRLLGRLVLWLVVMVVLGLALGAVQLVPLYELVKDSFRQGSASLAQIRGWAWPSRQILTFLLPNVFGNPTHHSYFDIWARAWMPVTQNALGEPLATIDWGVKNYVEGGNYLGLPTLLLAGVAILALVSRGINRLLRRDRVSTGRNDSPYRNGFIRTETNQGEPADLPQPTSQPAGNRATSPSHFTAAGFAVLAILSLLFAFGTPLYAVLYYLVPGYGQLHSAFRWVYPYTLSMAVLAGFGLDLLLRSEADAPVRRIARALGWFAALAGAGALAVVAISLFIPGPFVTIGDRLLAASDLAATRGFASGAMAWSYEAINLAQFGLLALLGGLVLLWGARRGPGTVAGRAKQAMATDRPPDLQRGRTLARKWAWPIAVLLLLVADLWLYGHDFNTAADRELLDFKPPVVQWLQDQQDAEQPWRLTTFDAPDEKLLNANAAMPYGLEDIRGYDSIIPKQYVAYMDRIQPQTELLYNRIAPIYAQWGDQSNLGALDNPLLNLLGVRYVMTTQTLPNAGYELAYDGEVKVYENRNALPRAFIVPEAVTAPDQQAALDTLQQVDPREVVVVEGLDPAARPPASSPALREARISRRGNRELFVDVNISDRGWLVLTDNYADGWKAYLRPYGVEGEGVNAQGESIEEQLPLYRADGTFRAVYLPEAGQWTVRFVYSPRSLLVGVYVSFLAAIALLLLVGWWAWGRYYRGEGSEVGTVAKNSAVQMVMSLVNKGIDFVFAMLRLRVLSPSGEGSYAFAIAFYTFFEIITRYGLGTLLCRDVALDKRHANRYLVNVIGLRTLLWLASLPVMFLVALFYRVALHELTVAEAQTMAIFAGALLFANIADAVSSVFNGFEKMEYPAGVSTATAAAKVALGALVILPPFDMGFVGLAWVSLVMNLVQTVWLYVLLRRKVLPRDEVDLSPTEAATGRGGAGRFDWRLQRYMLRESGPLMINNLLASIFWRIDLWVLRAFAGAAAVGIFSAGVKYLDGLNVIPAYFTLAIFPLMSRYAQADKVSEQSGGKDPEQSRGKDSLSRAYRLAVQLLFMVALPIAVFVTFASTTLIRILGGAAYLPDSATALSIMIWSVPIGFVNSVTQYALIAVNQQRFLTRAFLIGVAFTGIANIVLVPRYGYVAAAAILIPAELSLFIPFYWAVRRYVTPMPWFSLLWRPVVAACLDAAVVWSLARAGSPDVLAWIAGFLVYLAMLLALGAFRGEEYDVIKARLPGWTRWGLRRT